MKYVILCLVFIIFACTPILGVEDLLTQLVKPFVEPPVTSIDVIKKELKKYIATPWDMTLTTPDKSVKDYPKLVAEVEKSIGTKLTTKVCEENATVRKKACPSHAGNLIEHTQWVTLNIQKWFNTKSPVIEGVDLKKALIGGFLHDVGKAGDCIFDMYNFSKYPPDGDSERHAGISGTMISGARAFYKCDGTTQKDRINFRDAFKDYIQGDTVWKELTVVGAMHWAFGDLNMEWKDPSLDSRVNKYIDLFKKTCAEAGIAPSLDLLKLCMAVSCADISGMAPFRVSDMKYALPPVYVTFDIWHFYKMDEKFLFYREKVVQRYKELNPRTYLVQLDDQEKFLDS